MADFPALPLWTDAYLADTRHLSTLQHGAYLLLMMEAWRRPTCSLPDDDVLLARLCGLDTETWLANRGVVMALWKLDGRTKSFVQKRLTKEKSYVKKRSKLQRDKAAKRWENSGKRDAAAHAGTMPDQCPEGAPTPTPTPTPTPPKKEKEVGAGAPRDFAFEGSTIRLNRRDFDKWQSAYHAIPDFVAELTSLDAWFESDAGKSKKKSWFHTVSGALSRKHQDILTARRQAEANGSTRKGGGTPLGTYC